MGIECIQKKMPFIATKNYQSNINIYEIHKNMLINDKTAKQRVISIID
jgi:hypothetical protein